MGGRLISQEAKWGRSRGRKAAFYLLAALYSPHGLVKANWSRVENWWWCLTVWLYFWSTSCTFYFSEVARKLKMVSCAIHNMSNGGSLLVLRKMSTDVTARTHNNWRRSVCSNDLHTICLSFNWFISHFPLFLIGCWCLPEFQTLL